MLINCCERNYQAEQLVKEGIEVHEHIFDDGQLPPQEIIDSWLSTVDKFFDPKIPQGAIESKQSAAAAAQTEEKIGATAAASNTES